MGVPKAIKDMKLLIRSIFALLIIAGLSSSTLIDRELKKEDRVVWLSFEEAVEKSKSEKRMIFIDVYTDWCGWCKKMDATTFNEEKVAEYLNEYFYAVKFNAEQKEDIVFKDHTFKYVAQGRRGYHELAASLLQGKLSYPTVVFLDEDFNMIQPLPGYRDAKSFHPILEFFGKSKYKEMDWTAFQTSYQSPYN